MDLEKEYLCVEQIDCVFNKSVNCEEEFQESLPQYCDDIKKIIKCVSNNEINSSNIDNSEIKIYGKCHICITYLTEDNSISYADFEEDFVKSVNCEAISNTAFLSTDIVNKYTNYRVINQRRIDIHSAFDIHIKAFDKTTCPCVNKCENSKLNINSVKCSNIIATNTSKCEFDEEIEIQTDSNNIKRIIGYSGYVSLNETKIIKDKALVKANITLNILYTQDMDSEDIYKCVHNFDVSKIIDIPGLLDTDTVLSELCLGNVFLKPKSSQDGCLNKIQAIGDTCIYIKVIRQKEISYVNDGYILNRKSTCNYQEFKCNKDARKVCDKIQKEFEIKLNDNIDSIIDISLNINSLDVKNNKCTLNLESNVLCKCNNELGNYNSVNDIVLFNDDFDDGIVDCNICSYDYNIKNNECISIRVVLGYEAILYKKLNDRVLTEIECLDDLISYPSLTVYFAKENELVWDIAKKFSSDEELIIKENDLKSKKLNANKILIIPGL